ncbi:sterol 3-beta-glucosyltransferase UGT80A2 isoform X3 [Cucumis melo]|uniref:Sterol 3-beta-glucosyltransferase UGT80A2 isoform X3 n=1 Tax=Cucumis melo TaxID=3656 RepID=A0A1S3BI19_CUCME|nr:sterol 3-beta-glucosyltransferase UGT80A2 isoform X3 [Cucumis melo]
MGETLDRHPTSAFSSSEVDVSIELDARIENGSAGAGAGAGATTAADVLANKEVRIEDGGDCSPGISGKTLLKVNTMPIQTSNIDQLESDSSQHKLERSKTEVHKHNKFLPEEAAKIFDDKIPVHRKDYGHRVRLATHSNFKEFVLTAGLEFFALGGDPKILAGYMVKNKGFLPSGPSEIPVQRNQMKEIIYSLLPACKDPDPESGIPFEAEAIIANPPAYGHTHVAEALKIPIHIFFTMPWTPTSEFPHPLSRVKQQAGYRLSYQIVDSLIWLGIRDMINDLRKKRLKLRPVTYLSGSHASESNVPHGYIWSPHLVPKPKDWGPKVDVVGFCFLDLASNYEPPESLVNWLKAGDKPIYIGFGSLPVQEPAKMTQIIVKALESTGQRGIINKGWGGLGNLEEPKDFVYLLDNCPHDWLFLQCKAVVHHGGAGTTAAGLKAACPTTIIPFFGDQPFWGERVHARGVGPAPIPVEEFSFNKLVEAINFMLDPKVKQSALELAKAMENEDGVEGAVKAFFKHYRPKKAEQESEPEDSTVFSICRCFGCS